MGDIVLVHDPGPIKGEYLLATMEEVNKSKDGSVRFCVVKNRVPDPKAVVRTDSVEKMVIIRRSVQRLALLLPLEE